MNLEPNSGAFPSVYDVTVEGRTDRFVQLGLTKREHFAAMAMQGLLANQLMTQDYDKISIELKIHLVDVAAKVATKAADALIEALNKPK